MLDILKNSSPRCEIQNEYEIHGNEKSQNIEELATDTSPLKALLVYALPLLVAASGCKNLHVKFIMLDGDATLNAIEDDIVSNLTAINIHVTTSKLEKDPFNTAMNNGDWNLAFSETWGPPYDPHR